MAEETVPSLEGFFTEDGGARVLGSKCTTCGTPYFPKVTACHNPDCTNSVIEDCSFGGKGVVWSYSVANFPPPPPHKHDEPFVPYALAVVDMEAGIRLVGQMVDKPEEAKVGSQVELVIDAIYHEDGKAFTSWKFKQL